MRREENKEKGRGGGGKLIVTLRKKTELRNLPETYCELFIP